MNNATPVTKLPGKLGKLEVKLDARTLKFARYYEGGAPPPPSAGWDGPLNADLGMLGNDTVGDCTCAAVGHAVQTFSASESTRQDLITDDVLRAYSAITGYDGTPATDSGAYCLDVLNYWRANDIGGRRLDAFVKVSPFSHKHTMAAISEFGGLYIGAGLPTSIEGQVVWDDGTAPWSAGGHCVFVVGYDQNGLTCVTWGTLQRMTWAFWDKYVDEAYALLDVQDWVGMEKSPSGFDRAQLLADLSAVTGG